MLWLGKPDLYTSWEPGSSLPSVAIDEFEKGLVSEGVENKKDQYGHETHTIITAEKNQPAAKRICLERPVINDNSGYVSTYSIKM